MVGGPGGQPGLETLKGASGAELWVCSWDSEVQGLRGTPAMGCCFPGGTAGSYSLGPFSAAPSGLAAHPSHPCGLIAKWNHMLPVCVQPRRRTLAPGMCSGARAGGPCRGEVRGGTQLGGHKMGWQPGRCLGRVSCHGLVTARKLRIPGAPGMPQSESSVPHPTSLMAVT